MKPDASNRMLLLWLTILFALAALIRLGGTVLWQDEAETALVAYATMQHGIPSVDLGRNIMFEGGHQYNEDHVWTWQTWMPYYVGAASFLTFGKTTWAARFPFALMGILCIPLTALLARRLLRSRALGLLSAFFLAANVPFLLFTRQCRNYSLVTLAVILLLLAYTRFLRREKQGTWWLAAACALTFHCHLLIFAGILVGVLVHYAALRLRSLEDCKRMAWPMAGAFALTFPWFLYAGGFDRPGQVEPASFLPNLLKLLFWVNNYIFPWLLLVLPILAARRTPPRGKEDRLLSVLVVVPLAAILTWSVCSQVFFRYLVVLIPAASMGLAFGIHWLWTSSLPMRRAVGIVIVALLLLTNVWAVLPVRILAPPLASRFRLASKQAEASGEYLRSRQFLSASNALLRRMKLSHPFNTDLWDRSLWIQMIGELSEGVRGPMDAIIEYLDEHAQPDEVAWIGYGELPVMFYTDLKVVSYYTAALKSDSYKNADWIIPRSFPPFNIILNGELHRAAAGKFTRGFNPYLAKNYRHITLPDTDLMFNNRPNPDSHFFRAVTGPPPLHLFHRITPKRAD